MYVYMYIYMYVYFGRKDVRKCTQAHDTQVNKIIKLGIIRT